MNIKIGKYELDQEQTKIVLDESKHLLVVAGAGSGKTLTILGKIKYLIEHQNILKEDILCISFTTSASNDLKRKIKEELHYDMAVYTFHKLGLEILKKDSTFDIADENLLNDIIDEYFYTDTFNNSDILNIVLQYFNLKNIKEYKKFLKENTQQIISLKNLLSTFIHLFKASDHVLDDFLNFLDQAKLTLNIKKYKREKLLLKMALNIYMKYENYLEDNNEIDFDDMLLKAKKSVENGTDIHRWKYIIIDEFQDTSQVRFNLINSILNKIDANLLVVGDDFQSIYRFTGCDITLFLEFNKIFEDAKILKIENTYRNSQELISVLGIFIMKNKSQIKKQLTSNKNLKKPIVIIEYKDRKQTFLNVINKICQNNEQDIMVLGRNNKDINVFLDSKKFKLKDDQIIFSDYPHVKITYLTVHKSKGLESDNVVVLNLENSILGFPNQMKDDKILRFVSPHSSKYPFDEERRLFYVALSRTKNRVYLLCPRNNKSIFIDELLKDHKKYIEYKKRY